jgi:uncharacterized protein YbjQ (UPF0145 family)
MSGFRINKRLGVLVCTECAPHVEREAEERAKSLLERSEEVIVTTTPNLEGYRIDEYLGIESVEFVIGTGLLSELTTDFQDFLGKRSSAFEGKLQVAKREALSALKCMAVERKANAVVGIDLDYTEFSGNRIGLIISGTLVSVSRL